MQHSIRIILLTATLLTIGGLISWQATGGDYYTKFEVIEQVETKPDPSDPLAEAGFYDNGVETRTISRKEFRLGLLPTPQSFLDRHLLSVVTLTFLIWTLAAVLIFLVRWKSSSLLEQP